ncbi:hypothetical protein [Haliangium sp.]|uniref:hypothetical protein n=1 Tax=Haliangium sp. TaxID=2663208 RepID=UPI003D0B28DC
MRNLKTTLAAVTLMLALGGLALGACGNKGQPEGPDPEPQGCCQFDDRCVQVDDASACTQRGGEFVDNASCANNQCSL